MKNIVILSSGSGSNMAAIIRAAEEQHWAKRLKARVSAVISSLMNGANGRTTSRSLFRSAALTTRYRSHSDVYT